jgi:CheY-like chemotaxis protein/anti-sigma regulatory factor (Ser/Thr protein kinase)
VSLNDAVAVVADLRRGTFEQAGLRLEVEALPAAPVQAEQQRLQGVFFNIVNNALHAMTPRGRGTLRVHGEARGDTALVIFDDEGPGLLQPDRVFEPFFTTKEVGEGTGLGLAISKRFVDAFGGEIRAENRPTGGARFTVALRFADGDLPVAPPAEVALPKQLSGSRSVLVVEDEPDLRRLAAKVLRRLGVEVLQAGNVAEARAVLEQRQVDAVVSDVRMPGGSGVDLYRWVEQHRPELVTRFLFVTGDVDAEELGSLAHDRPEALLHKPFTISDLLQRVEAMLKD